MDSALKLKRAYDVGIILSEIEIDHMLASSELVQTLTAPLSYKSLSPIWRFIALAEIPYSFRLDYTQKLADYVDKIFATEVGFSLTGKPDDLLPCYNAMLIEAMSKLGQADRLSVKTAVKWIKNYQVFERNRDTTWLGSGIKKYGGCMKGTPCYIGIAKSVKALIYYNLNAEKFDHEVDALINIGTNYLLEHHLFQRLSDQKPITTHILDIAYPPSYHLNIVELLEIAYLTENMNDIRVTDALAEVNRKKTKNQDWRINSIYKADGYISFDRRGQKGEWVSYLLGKYLGEKI